MYEYAVKMEENLRNGYLKKQVRPTVYQQKLSGNMRRVLERQQRIIGEMTLILTKLVNMQMF